MKWPLRIIAFNVVVCCLLEVAIILLKLKVWGPLS